MLHFNFHLFPVFQRKRPFILEIVGWTVSDKTCSDLGLKRSLGQKRSAFLRNKEKTLLVLGRQESSQQRRKVRWIFYLLSELVIFVPVCWFVRILVGFLFCGVPSPFGLMFYFTDDKQYLSILRRRFMKLI